MCDICHDTGFLRSDVPLHHPDFGKLVLCDCQKFKVMSGIQERIGTPFNRDVRLLDVKYRGEGSRSMKEAALKFVDSPCNFLTIYGLQKGKGTSANGNGKSTCLQAITNELLLRGVSVLYMAAADMMEYLKAGIQDDTYDVEARLSVLSTMPVLCVDEISQPNWTPWVDEKFGVLIDRRYRLSLGTVLALDEDPYIFLHRRIVSRLLDGVLVPNSDPDMRAAIGVRS